MGLRWPISPHGEVHILDFITVGLDPAVLQYACEIFSFNKCFEDKNSGRNIKISYLRIGADSNVFQKSMIYSNILKKIMINLFYKFLPNTHDKLEALYACWWC